jgi:hypothetical protein
VDIYKITLQREFNRPRLARFADYLEVVTFIKAVSLRHAEDIAKDMVKEHGFVEFAVEPVQEEAFREEMETFLMNEEI